MRILFCAGAAPLPPLNGLRLLIDALLRELRRDHDVRVLAFHHADQLLPEHPDAALRLVPRGPPRTHEWARTLVASGLRLRPVSASPVAAQMRGPLGEELRRFRPDVVHVSAGRLAPLGAELTGWPSVLAALDARHLNVEAQLRMATGGRRLLLHGELRRVRRLEASKYRLFGHVVVVTPTDRDALLEQDPTLRISVIPNGVDADGFAPRPGLDADPDRLVFTGVMSYEPNVLAAEVLARRILPRVRAVRPRARLCLVGRDPSPRVLALGELAGVTVTGAVPEVQPWLASGRVYVCPMQSGTGIKNKLLEAMACGSACVATPLALQGLQCIDGRDVLVGQDEASLAGAVVRVLADDGLAHRLGVAARSYVVEHHSWVAVARTYADLYRQVVDAAPAHAARGKRVRG